MKTNRIPNEGLAPQRSADFSRRRFLRGLGACVALPAFESLSSVTLLAGDPASVQKLATTASGAPLRTAFVYFPNGAIPSSWWPKSEGSDFALNQTMQPLTPFREHLQILGGLEHLNATAGNDGGGDHARANGTFLTGVRMKKSEIGRASCRERVLTDV